MKEEYKDFIGIYDESIPIELSEMFVVNYEEAKKNRTIIDLTKENETKVIEHLDPLKRMDEVAFVTPLFSTIYPRPPVDAYFKFLNKCLKRYVEKYGIEFKGTVYNDIFKIHKVRKSEGFHSWHYERAIPSTIDRIMAYMTYLEAPKEGGETEFLHQSLRIKPIVGRTLIWPAGYTHMHRGNPPIDGEKMYITGLFNAAKMDMQGDNNYI
jgi:prolyl 4-hydroxylase